MSRIHYPMLIRFLIKGGCNPALHWRIFVETFNIYTMTQIQIENSIKDLNRLVIDGKVMEAFETYYHEEVAMQENELPATVSKEANRKRELEFLSNIAEFRKAEVKGIAVQGNVSFVIWSYDYTHKSWGIRDYTQVSVQEWKDGQIIRERFIYLN